MSDLEAAVAAGVLGADEAHRSLLQATVEVARAIFGAKAASVFLLDEETDELVFEAVAGEGEGELIGMRFPADTGIAGWVLTTRQPLIALDLLQRARRARAALAGEGRLAPLARVAARLEEGERDTAFELLQALERVLAESSRS